jgi:hypothetical protein
VELYRERWRREVDELLQQLTAIDREPSDKEAIRGRLILLRRDIVAARTEDDRLIASQIRDLRAEIEKLKASV